MSTDLQVTGVDEQKDTDADAGRQSEPGSEFRSELHAGKGQTEPFGHSLKSGAAVETARRDMVRVQLPDVHGYQFPVRSLKSQDSGKRLPDDKVLQRKVMHGIEDPSNDDYHHGSQGIAATLPDFDDDNTSSDSERQQEDESDTSSTSEETQM